MSDRLSTTDMEQDMNDLWDKRREEEPSQEEIDLYNEYERFFRDNQLFDVQVTLIPEDDFKDYAQEYAEEIGAVPESYTWPISCIDWEHAAKELSYDYNYVEFNGDYYYYREN